MQHINIPIFVPHLGCPHTCVFCNQKTITGKKNFSLKDAFETVETVLTHAPKDAEKEIAFFGGSFTAIDRTLMCELLEMAKSYRESGQIAGIRLSTRPDAIDPDILSILQSHGVTTIELGIQSTDPEVLLASERGHTAEASEKACRLIKKHSFSLVGQMMLGLPTSTFEKEKKTAQDMLSWGIDAVRIYPTVIFKNTALEKLQCTARYMSLSVLEAAERTGRLIEVFDRANIPILRIGLCENEGLRSDHTVGGAHHAALGELSYSVFFRREIEKRFAVSPPRNNTTYIIETAPSALSQVIGQKKCNLRYFKERYPQSTFLFKSSSALSGKEVKIQMKEN